MATMAVPTGINILGEYGAGVSIRFDEINRNFGGRYDETELVGPTTGTLFLRLNYGFLTAGTELTVVDAENANTVTPWAAYVWKFFIRRKQDQAIFTVAYTDPATESGTTGTFRFVDSELSYQTVTYLLYSAEGILLQQSDALA